MTPLRAVRDPSVLLAFGLGTGLLPRAPGTFGTLLAIPLWWIFHGAGIPVCLALSAAGFVFGVWLCDRATAVLGEHDHPGIVIDEVVGYFVALVVVPPNLVWLGLSFLVFRLFDILKPWPIGWLDRKVEGGLGIMLDDLIAGILTAVVMLAVIGLSG